MSGTRPNPLGEAASRVGVAWSAVSGVVSALVAYGVLTITQATAIREAGEAIEPTVTAVGAVVAAITPVISGIVAAYRTAAAGREHVTPMSDPRAHDGTKLIPAAAPTTLTGRSG